MTKVHPHSTAIKIDEDETDIGNNNANNNNNNNEKLKDKKSSLLFRHHDGRNGYLYRPNVASKEEIAHPISSSTSLANGRRLLVTGKTLKLPGQEFVEDITKCLSNTNHIYVRKTKYFSRGLMGFKVGSCYEVLNENKMRVCILGLTNTFFNGFQFIIVNPFGVDAFTYKKFFCVRKPDKINGPGMSPYSIYVGRFGSVNFANEKNWFQLQLGFKGTFFPHWTFPFCNGKSGPNFKFINGLDRVRTLAKVSRDCKMENDKSPTMKIKFAPSLSAEDRIVLFSASLHTFFYHFVPRGRFSTSWSYFVQTTIWTTVFFVLTFFLCIL